ncbi:hypothetical protein [Myxococcus phage Mx1]|nr:hypothetical protein [Myxococcus phage Mx1]
MVTGTICLMAMSGGLLAMGCQGVRFGAMLDLPYFTQMGLATAGIGLIVASLVLTA